MTNTPTDFDILARNAAAMNAEEERRVEPHWSDDPAFESEARFNAYKDGLIPYPRAKDDEWVFIEMIGDVAEYRKRSQMTGVDHSQRRDHLNRELQKRACKVVYEYGKDKP